MNRAPHSRRLRRLRSILALLGIATALLVAAACRLEATARIAAVAGVAVCLVAWVFVLDAEGRLAERVESRLPRRRGPPPGPVARRGSARRTRKRRAA